MSLAHADATKLTIYPKLYCVCKNKPPENKSVDCDHNLDVSSIKMYCTSVHSLPTTREIHYSDKG